MDKIILDVCCGSRMCWFDKVNSSTVFGDLRKESHVLCDGRALNIAPDIQLDFRCLPFVAESFKLVVFDPPHLRKAGKGSWLAKKYGILSDNWADDISKGFGECMRVLELNGVLIFKWSCDQVSVKEVLSKIKYEPLFGHTTGRSGKTMWMAFIKI